MRIEEIEKDLKTLKKIKFNKTAERKNKFNNFKDVIDLAVINGVSTVPEKGKGCQCGPGRRRGYADLYRLTNYYFPGTKLCDIINYTKQNKNIHVNFCVTTNQNVSFQNIFPNGIKLYESPRVRLSNRKCVKIEN